MSNKNGLKDLVPILMCDDVQHSIGFYTDVLGFQVKAREDDLGKSGWAYLTQGPVDLMLASPSYLPDPVKVDGQYPQLQLYFYPDDVRRYRDTIVERGAGASPLETRAYGMLEFQVVDPSGHVLVFGQELEPADQAVG